MTKLIIFQKHFQINLRNYGFINNIEYVGARDRKIGKLKLEKADGKKFDSNEKLIDAVTGGDE